LYHRSELTRLTKVIEFIVSRPIIPTEAFVKALKAVGPEIAEEGRECSEIGQKPQHAIL
jgi:hypothetical protein